MVDTAKRVWNALKSQAYGDVDLPRSSHDPDYSDEDQQSFESLLAEYERTFGGPDASIENAPSGFFGRLKAKFLGDAPPTTPPTAPPPTVATSLDESPAVPATLEVAPTLPGEPISQALLEPDGCDAA